MEIRVVRVLSTGEEVQVVPTIYGGNVVRCQVEAGDQGGYILITEDEDGILTAKLGGNIDLEV